MAYGPKMKDRRPSPVKCRCGIEVLKVDALAAGSTKAQCGECFKLTNPDFVWPTAVPAPIIVANWTGQ